MRGACYLPRFVWFIRRREGCPCPCAGAVYNLQNIESRVLFTHWRLPMAIQKKNIWPVLDPNNAFCIWRSRNKSIFQSCNLIFCTSEKNKPCHLLEVVSGKLNINQGCTNKSPVCNFAFTFPKHFQGKYGRKSWPNMQHEFSKPKLLHCKNFYLQNSSGQKDRLFSIMSLCPCACCAYCWCW